MADLPKFSAQFDAMFREAVKDIRSTIMETMLGSPELGGEMGTPMNPTPQMTTQELGTVHSDTYEQALDQQAAPAPPQQERQR